MKYQITYTDNQDLAHKETVISSSFCLALQSVEIEANESGHGMKCCTVTRTNEAEVI